MSYKYRPKNKEELIKAIKKEIYEVQGSEDNPNWNADLNCIDTSLITDMSYLFAKEEFFFKKKGFNLNNFNGDISNWNVRNVENMEGMFAGSEFNGNISKWDVSNVKNMKAMFNISKFNQDISKWNVNNIKNMSWMFYKSKFNKDISNWNVSNVESMFNMFAHSKFNKDISKWNIKTEKITNIFWSSDFNKDIGSWSKELRKLSGLKNISNSIIFKKLPDEIIYPETLIKVFIRSINNSDNIFNTNNFNKIFKAYLKNKKQIYRQKKYPEYIINKLIVNNIADIFKHIKDKNMQDKFMKITMNKDSKEPDIDIS